MADALTAREIEKLLAQLPREHDDADIARRVCFTTSDGRKFLAYVRAGVGKLSFAGCESKPDMTAEDEWEYFVLGAEKPGDPLQLVHKQGPLGVVVAAELEDRGK